MPLISAQDMAAANTVRYFRVPQRQIISCQVENVATFEERSSASVIQIWTFSAVMTDDSDPNWTTNNT